MKKVLFALIILSFLVACSNGDGPKQNPNERKTHTLTKGEELISQGIDSLVWDPQTDTIIIK